MKEKIEGKLYFMCGLALGIVIAFLLGCFVAGITAAPTNGVDVGSGVPLPTDGGVGVGCSISGWDCDMPLWYVYILTEGFI